MFFFFLDNLSDLQYNIYMIPVTNHLRGGVWERIEACKHDATKTEKKLIEKLRLVRLGSLIYMSVTELALATEVAEATIVRFCRRLGFSGFQDFKLNLSREVSAISNEAKEDKLFVAAAKIKDAIDATRHELSYPECLEIANRVINAKRVLITAVGNSSTAAFAFYLKLLSVGIAVNAPTDPHIMSTMAANMNSDDLILIISVSGSTKDILGVAEEAKKHNTNIVAITNHFQSPLTKYADYLLYNCHKESPQSAGKMATIISQLYVVDVLYSAVCEKLADAADQRSKKVSDAMANKLI